MTRVFFALSLVFTFLFCKPQGLDNLCDPKSKNFWETTFIKNVIRDRSPGCHPFFERAEPDFLTYGAFFSGSAGDIFTSEVAKDKLYIGGNFDELAATTGGGAFVWKDSALPIASTYCPQLDLYKDSTESFGNMHTAVLDPEGNIYIVGDFSHVQGIPRFNIAKLKNNCTLDLDFDVRLKDNASAFYDILYLESKLFISGNFNIGTGAFTDYPVPTVRNLIASVDAKTGIVNDFAPNIIGTDVRRMATDGTFIYFGGDFNTINGSATGNLGKLHKDNGLGFYSFPSAGGGINTVKIHEGVLYVGGNFSNLNSGAVLRSKVAAIDLSNNSILPIFQSLTIGNNIVSDIQITESKIYIAGDFALPSVALITTDRSGNLLPTNFQIVGPVPSISKLSLIDKNLYVFGFFDTARGLDRKYFFQIDTETDSITDWNPKFLNLNSVPQGVALPIKENVVLLGGGFGALDVRKIQNLAEIDLITGYPSDWRPNPNQLVQHLAVSSDTLFVHGQFTEISGIAQNQSASFTLETKTLLEWKPTFNFGSVETMLNHNDSIFVGGSFTETNGSASPQLVKLNAITGARDNSFNPSFNSAVRSIQIYDGELYVAGQFTTSPNPSPFLTVLNLETGGFIRTHNDTFANNFSAYSMFISDNRVLLSGQYSVTSPNTSNSFSVYQIPNLSSIPLSQSFDDFNYFVRSIDQTENRIFLAGNLLGFGGQTRENIFSINRSDLRLNDWNPKFNSGASMRKLQTIENSIFVFGNFSAAGNFYRVSHAKIHPLTGIPY